MAKQEFIKRKGELTSRFLEVVSDAARAVSDIAIIFSAPYGTSLRGMDYRLDRARRERRRQAYKRSEQRFFSNLLYRLERDGLITTQGRGSEKIAQITAHGSERLKELRRMRMAVSLKRSYPYEQSESVTIITFDIPERERWKRGWLRSVLKRLKFRMLQQSVWIGKTKIPREFMDDLKRLHLIPHVEILAVTKAGSLRHME